MGYIVGLMASLWLGIGRYVYSPIVPTAPVSTAGCNVTSDNVTMMSFADYNVATEAPYAPEDRCVVVCDVAMATREGATHVLRKDFWNGGCLVGVRLHVYILYARIIYYLHVRTRN